MFNSLCLGYVEAAAYFQGWYGFAKKIFEVNHVSIDLKGISTSEYPTLAKRPKYSVLDTSKIKKEFNISIKSWEEALQ